MLAVRENERGAQAFSVNVIRTKLVAFAMSGFVAALAGGLFALHQHARLTALLGAEENLRLFLVAVVGGLASATGVLASVTLFQFVDFFVPSAEVRFLFNGFGVLLILLVYPSGLGGIIYDVRDGILRRIARAKGIHVPSLVADSSREQREDRSLTEAEQALEDHGVVPEEVVRAAEAELEAEPVGVAR
jgi:branched-chain amino acid transport system permease protein